MLGLVFLLAGLSKARAPASFERSLAQYGVLPSRLRPVVAGGLPATEVLIGACLALGVLAAPASAVALTLLVMFTAASLVSSKNEEDCGCFGSFGTLNVKNIVARNALFAALALTALAAGASGYTLEASLGVLPALATAACIAAALLLAARSMGAAITTAMQPQILASDMGRRSFLGKLAVLGAGSLATGAMIALRGAPKAEAACYGCTSCGYGYFWIACTGLCCAAFWQVPYDYCPPYCNTCGSWIVVTFCGYPQCC
jgi:uncharacterized membrane protein YphA (DoxX/SURF4 family)